LAVRAESLSPEPNLVEFFTSIKLRPTISEFDILSLLNATVILIRKGQDGVVLLIKRNR